MPDQVRVPDPLPNRAPTVSAPLPIKMSSQQDLLLNYHDYAASSSPGTSHSSSSGGGVGGRMLLDSGSLTPPKQRLPSQDWRLQLPPGTSPHSSGYSDGSCGSSPARSPKDLRSQLAVDDDVMGAAGAVAAVVLERPLSLVIRKNRTHYADPNSNLPEYTVHQRGSFGGPRYPPYAPTPAVAAKEADEEELSRDSGTEEDLEPPLVISEPEPEELEEEEEEQMMARDLSLKKTTTSATKTATEANEEDEDKTADDSKESAAAAVIKIRDFARFSSAGSEDNQMIVAATAEMNPTAPAPDDDNMSDVSSECPESLSSEDTWRSSFEEGRPFVPGTGNVVMRRVSRSPSSLVPGSGGGGDTTTAGGAASSVSYQCDFCERIFGSKSHLESHLVTHTGERAFNCRLCRKTFGRKSTLRAHMTTHTKTSNFMCTVCEKACNDNNSLEEHMRMHTGKNDEHLPKKNDIIFTNTFYVWTIYL